jgi:hypothetical protein
MQNERGDDMTALSAKTRAVHLVDIENLVGGPRASAADVEHVLVRYLEVAGWRWGDIVSIAANPGLALEFAWNLPVEASVHTASGPDGADLALLAHAAPEFVARRAGRLVIGSGDHAFIPRAIAARDRGVGVLVVARAGGVSSGWRAHGFPVVAIDTEPHRLAA